jgi:multidrug resistance efflux pump
MEQVKPPAKQISGLWFVAAGVLIIGGVLGGLYFVLRKEPPAPVASTSATPTLPAGADVTFTGKIAARSLISLPAPVSGVLDRLDVTPGTPVFEGQKIAHIKNDELTSARDLANENKQRAQTRLENIEASSISARLEASRANAELARVRLDFTAAEKNYLKQQMIYKAGALAKLKWQQIEKEYTILKQDLETIEETAKRAQDRADAVTKDLELAKAQLDEMNAELELKSVDMASADITSPVDGMLVGAKVDVGGDVSLTMTDLFTISPSPGELQVTIQPNKPVLDRLKIGLPAWISIVDLDENIEGVIAKIEGDAVTVEFNTNNADVKPNTDVIVRIRLP